MRHLVLTVCAAAVILTACGSAEENQEGSGASGATTGSGSASGGSGQGGSATGSGGNASSGQGGAGGSGTGGSGTGGAGTGGMGQAGAGGAPPGCVDVSGDYGLCDLALGWGFDGQTCTQFNGCDCAPNCMSFFMTLEECQNACGL